MPTTYTHYAYGQEVFHKLPEELQRKIEPYIEYYNIGVHGPDILFYYHLHTKFLTAVIEFPEMFTGFCIRWIDFFWNKMMMQI